MKFVGRGLCVVAVILISPTDIFAKNQSLIVDCNKPQQSVQAVIDGAAPGVGTTIFFTGQCSENLTITKDAITLSGDVDGLGDPGGQGTISGEIDVKGAHNISLEFITVTGAGGGIYVRNGADVEIIKSVINNNDSLGVWVSNGGIAKISGTSIKNNNNFGGLFIQRNSVVELECDNEITGNVGDAIFLEEGSSLRTSICDSPNGPDVIVAESGSAVLTVFNGSIADVRGVQATGPIAVHGTATFRAQYSEINGDVDAKVNSFVGFRPNVTFAGALTCDGTSGVFEGVSGLGNVQCGQTCSGVVPGACSP